MIEERKPGQPGFSNTDGPSRSVSPDYESRRVVKKIVDISLFTAIGVVCGYLLIAVPNVELISAVVALAGLLTGSLAGAAVGVLTITIYSGLNAWGLPYPPVWIAQMLGFGIVGFLFGFLKRFFISRHIHIRIITSVTAGFIVTLIYDLLTNIAFPLSTGILSIKGWIPYLTLAIPFTAIHIGSNIVIFALVVPVVFSRLRKLRRFSSPVSSRS